MNRQLITLGGGCFWCLEAVYELVDGVTAVESGYCNGHVKNPSYEQVCGGDTGHAEVVRVEFDGERISLREILEIFFAIHDPTTRDRQGNDVGPQYRSAIFYTSERQRAVAEASKAKAQARWKDPITTEITAAPAFERAEEFHQDYLEKHEGGYTCHFLRD
jgi:peptide-methionine (S)-S-oxide reductase